jgi:hypothetical protein
LQIIATGKLGTWVFFLSSADLPFFFPPQAVKENLLLTADGRRLTRIWREFSLFLKNFRSKCHSLSLLDKVLENFEKFLLIRFKTRHKLEFQKAQDAGSAPYARS